MELTFDEDASSSSKRLRNLEILASGLWPAVLQRYLHRKRERGKPAIGSPFLPSPIKEYIFAYRY